MSTPFDGVEVETARDPRWAVIWLHGLGADGHDFEPIVPQLVARDWPAIRFVFPHAPVMPVTINGGMRMRAWYDITGMEIAQRQDESGIRGSVRAVDALIARENARGIPAERIVLAGFSQGGAIALATALRHPARLAGVVALSTYLPLAEHSERDRSDANRDVPIFMGHGTMDPIVGLQLGLISADRLRKLGHAVDWHQYPMQHSVCAEEVRDLARWLTPRLQG